MGGKGCGGGIREWERTEEEREFQSGCMLSMEPDMGGVSLQGLIS